MSFQHVERYIVNSCLALIVNSSIFGKTFAGKLADQEFCLAVTSGLAECRSRQASKYLP